MACFFLRSLAPALVTSDDIMAFDLDGNAIDPRGRSVFLERFIHGEIYKARPDVMAVVHTHSIYSTIIAIMEREIPPLHYMIAATGGKPAHLPALRTVVCAGTTDIPGRSNPSLLKSGLSLPSKSIRTGMR